MKTLYEHNEMMDKKRDEYYKTRHLAGVICTGCKADGNDIEMHYENVLMVNLSSPPTKYVKCPKCGFRALKTTGL